MEKLNTAYKCNDTSLHYAYIRDTDTLHNFRRENHEKKLNILPMKIQKKETVIEETIFVPSRTVTEIWSDGLRQLEIINRPSGLYSFLEMRIITFFQESRLFGYR